MATAVHNFALTRAMHGFGRALKSISREDGFNTSPVVQHGAVIMDKLEAFPTLAYEFGNLSPLSESGLQGASGFSTGRLRFQWQALVFGFVRTTQDRAALSEAGCALLADVYSAVYSGETLPDSAGQGSVLMINPGEIVFDMESFAQDKSGYFAAFFNLAVDLSRGANP